MDALTIGGATVAVSTPTGVGPWSVERLQRLFWRAGGSPVLDLAIVPHNPRPAQEGELCFDSGIGWQAMETTRGWSFYFWGNHRLRGRTLHHVLTVDRSWRAGTFCIPETPRSATPRPFPVGYPVEQLLFVGLLAHAAGAVVHATGIIHGGRGWVFAGPHGAGKSTLAALFRRRRDMTLLNDDRVILRSLHGQWRLFGTPWPGTIQQVSTASAPLAGICLIRHGTSTEAQPLAPSQAVARLLARCIHPYWDRQGLEALLGTIARLVQEVPCYDFPFVPHAPTILAALDTLAASGRECNDPRG